MALNPRYLSHVADGLEDLWGDFETEVLSELAKRIKANSLAVSATSKWGYVKLRELGYTSDFINKKLSTYLKKTEAEIQDIFSKAIGTALFSNQEIIQEAYEKGLILSSGYDIRDYDSVISLGMRQTFGEIINWTKSYHADVNKNFLLALDKAYLEVNSGLMTPAQASKQAIEELARNGILTSTTKDGRVEHADVIVKRAIRSGLNQTTSKVMNGVLDDLGCDLVEVTSHMGARPSHAIWQGGVYSLSGKHKKYPDFRRVTGYGTGDGLCGWNCRHMYFPFFEGLSSVSAKRYSMQENEHAYNLEQKQKYNERMIRKYRREESVLKAGGLDYKNAQNNAIKWSKLNDALIESNSGVLKKNYANDFFVKPTKGRSNIQSIKEEFMKNATPGVGNTNYHKDFVSRKDNVDERIISKWIVEKFGGNIELLPEYRNQKNPDYLWNGKFWDLKSPKGNKNITKLIQKGISQIENSPGGIILNYKFEDYDIDLTKKIIEERMKNKKFEIIIILKSNDKIIDIIKR